MTDNAGTHATTTRRHCGIIHHLWSAFAATALIAVTLIGAAPGRGIENDPDRGSVPGGRRADILARLLGEHISKAQGPTVVIENRPGGGASIAYEAVARAAPEAIL